MPIPAEDIIFISLNQINNPQRAVEACAGVTLTVNVIETTDCELFTHGLLIYFSKAKMPAPKNKTHAFCYPIIRCNLIYTQ